MEFNFLGKTIVIKGQELPSIQNNNAWEEYLVGRGYTVNTDTAIKVAAVIRCCDVVAKTMASLPLNLLTTQNGHREKATNHKLYKLLYRLPNKETTAYEFWHMYVFSLMLTSGAFAKIKRDKNGFITALWNIPTCNCSEIQHNQITGERYIDVWSTQNNVERLREGEFMYTPGLRFTSTNQSEDPIEIAADVLGLTLALNGYANDFFVNGSNVGGFIECEGSLSDTAYTRFKESWKNAYMGVKNQHKVAFLEDGLKFNALKANPQDSQVLESRRFAVNEICRIFGVPPHKVYDLDRATFSNIEHQNIEYAQESIIPMCTRIEQTIYKDLLTFREQDFLYTKFNQNALLRGDIAARTAYYHNGRQDGWLCADDIRELEDMDKLPQNAGGDVYCVNGNYIPLSSVPQNLPKGAKQ